MEPPEPHQETDLPIPKYPKIIDTGPRWSGFGTVIGSLETLKSIMEIDDKLKDGISCWRADFVERREGSKIEGRGLFSKEQIKEGTVVAFKGGRVVNEAKIREMTTQGILHGSHQQVGPDAFLVGLTPEEEDQNLVWYNHSCDPNAIVLIGEGIPVSVLIVKRDIKEGEEITVDYSVSHTSNTHRFLCHCGGSNCRVIIQPHYDFADREFQEQHKGEFPDYIQRYIDHINNLPEQEKKELLFAAGFDEAAGRIVVIADEIEKRKKQNNGTVKTDFDLWLEQRLILLSAYFASVYRGYMTNRCGLDLKNAKKFEQSVTKNLQKIVDFAREVDNLHGWIN